MVQVLRRQQQISLCGILFLTSQLFINLAWADDAATIADLKARLDKVEREVDQLTDSGNRDITEAAIPLHGFADVGYGRSSNDETRLDQASRGFWANSLDFYLTPQFTDKSKALIELIFEFAPDGNLVADLERMQFGHIFNDQLTVWLGRFHAPYGYWNTAFHHGAQIQTSLQRPRFIDFEDKGGLMPAHVMGAWATGVMPMGIAKVTYDAYVGNGNAIDLETSASSPDARGSLAINNSRDSNSNTLVGGNVGYQIGGLIVGAHGFSQRVNLRDANPTPLATGEISVKMTGLYGFYEDDVWESIAEYYRFKNEDLTPAQSGSHSSWLGFAQLGYAVGNDWMPYIRLEKGVLDQQDPYFTRQDFGVSYQRQVLGGRYTLNPKAVIKLELNRTKENESFIPAAGPKNGKYSEARVQYSIRF